MSQKRYPSQDSKYGKCVVSIMESIDALNGVEHLPAHVNTLHLYSAVFNVGDGTSHPQKGYDK